MSLIKLIIPENVACIERFSFRDTKRLRRVDFLGKAELDNQVFAGSAVKALYLHRGMALRPFLMQAVTLLCQPEEEGMIAFFKSMGYAVSDAGAWKALRLTHYRQVVSVPPPGALVEPSVRHIGKQVESFQYAGQSRLRKIVIDLSKKAAGVVGNLEGSMDGCYNSGTITGMGSNSTNAFGGLTGTIGGTISNCFYINAVKASGDDNSTGTNAINLAAIKDSSGTDIVTQIDQSLTWSGKKPIL